MDSATPLELCGIKILLMEDQNPRYGNNRSFKSLAPIQWLKSSPFVLMHIAAIGIFFVEFKWQYVVLSLCVYGALMFGITAGFHRYFSHRTYKTSRWFQFVLAWLGSMSTQKGVLWWAANHRHHHKVSDMPADIHSPIQDGFFWSHMGWIMGKEAERTRAELIKDLWKFPELRWLNRWYLLPPILFAVSLVLFGGWGAFFWGFVFTTVLLWHGTFTINSLSHVFGSRRYKTGDTSRNNFLLAIITLGEGWHNNHHCYQASANQGFFWWEIDVSFYTLKIMSWFGLVRDLKKAPVRTLEAKRIHPTTHTVAATEAQVQHF